MNFLFEIVKFSWYFNIEGGELDVYISFVLNYCINVGI